MVAGTKSGSKCIKSGTKGGYATMKAKLKKTEGELEEKAKALGEKSNELEKVKKEPASQAASAWQPSLRVGFHALLSPAHALSVRCKAKMQ
jgi:hypothetical protein